VPFQDKLFCFIST